jgi:protein TonB
MDFARQQRDPARHLIGITFVILIHAIVIYALVTGLARKAIEVIKKPLTATIIEEIKAPPPPPPPPPPKRLVEPPKAVQQTYVPPPDVPVPTQTTEPVISAVTPTAPTEPVVIAPPAPVVEAPPPKPAVRRGITPIFRVEPVYPREAMKDNIAGGKVVARLQVDEKGLVTNVTIVEANPRRVFDREVVRALSQWKFQPEGDRYIAEIEITFILN